MNDKEPKSWGRKLFAEKSIGVLVCIFQLGEKKEF